MERPQARQLIFLAVLLLVPSIAVAGENIWSSVSAQSLWTDNARRSTDNKISERQDKYSLSIGANYQGAFSDIRADYRGSWNTFSKKTQEDDGTLEGQGEIKLGKPSFPLGLDLRHSQRQVLDQQQEDLLENQDQRQISTAKPYINWRATKRDNIYLSGSYSDIRYDDAKARNSTNTGGSLAWHRRLTPVDSFGLGVSESDVNFDSRGGRGYTYQSAWANFGSQLRHLTYKLAFGQNKYITDGQQANSRPTYSVDITTDALAQRLNVNLSQRFTDTSRGNGNENDLSLANPSGSSSSEELDIYELRSGQILWTAQPFCNVCGFNLSGRYERELYESTFQDNMTTQLQAIFSYRIKPKTQISIIARGQNYEFDADSNQDFRQSGLGLRVNRLLAPDLDLSFLYNFEERNFEDNKLDYSEHRIGLSLIYRYQ